jgi:hypothetical protein
LLDKGCKHKNHGKTFPDQRKNSERVRWCCNSYCLADGMRCGHGADSRPHTVKIMGDTWRTKLVCIAQKQPTSQLFELVSIHVIF